jgi:acyl-CoA synthetase (AMP-forming)/AMP-acid ligase II
MARYDVALSYAQLDVRSDAIAAGLARHGIGRGIRTVVMVRPSPELFLLMFALFKAGAVPVLVDPGIDRRALKQCLDEAQPQAFIGIALAQVARCCWVGRSRPRGSSSARAGAGAAPRWRGSSATVPAPARNWPTPSRTR